MIFAKRTYWIIGIIICLSAWYIASYINLLDKSLLASPEETWKVIWQGDDFNGLSLWLHIKATLSNTLKGWFAVVLIGGLTAYIFSRRIFLSRSFKTIFEFARAIPPILIFPVLYIAYDQEPMSYIGTVIFGCLPIMFLTVLAKFQQKRSTAYEILTVSGASRLKLTLVTIFDNLPVIVLGARLCFSFALIIAVVTEMISSQDPPFGLGSLAKDAMNSFETPHYYAVLVILGIIGIVGNSLLLFIEKNAYSIYVFPSLAKNFFSKWK